MIVDRMVFEEVLVRQGVGLEDARESDFNLEVVTYADPADPTKTVSEWFAVPKEIVAFNPTTQEPETGKLLPSGAFVGSKVNLGDHLHPSDFGARAMVFGKSAVKNFSKIGEGSVISDATVFNSSIGKNTVLHAGAHLWGGDPFFAPIVGDNVHIGQKAVVGPKSRIGNGVYIGDKVLILESTIGDGVIVERTDPTDKRPQSPLVSKGPLTAIFSSEVKTGSTIESNASMSNTTVGENVRIGSGAVLDNTVVPDGSTVGEASILMEPRERGNGHYERITQASAQRKISE